MQPDFATLKPISNQPDFNTLTPVEEPQKVSGLKSFIQDTAKAFLKLPATVSALGAKTVALGAEVMGRPDIAQRIDKTVDEGIDYGYFGNVKPISSVKEAVGTGAEVGSYAIGGGGGATAVKTGLRGLLKQGFKEGVKTGAASGGLFSFGQSLQEAESKPMDVAYSTLFGTAIGGVAGGVLGAAVPLVTKGAKEALKFTKVPELQTKLSEGYQKIFNPTAKQIKADTRFGNNSFDFLAQEMPDLPITVNSSGRVEADAAIEMAKQKYAAEASAYKPIIRNSGKYIDIDSTIKKAKIAARKEFDGTDLAKAEQQIENEVNAYLSNTPQDVNVTARGDRFVTLSRADDIKSYSWARGKGWGTPEAEVWNDTNNIIGHTIKDAIEQQLPDAPIKAMNRRLGQWKNAIDLLEKRNGQVSGSGGKLSKMLTTKTGSVVGSIIGAGAGDDNRVVGGLGGAGAGFMTASALAALMSNPNARLFAVRQILKRLSNAGKNDMIKEAEDILKQQATRYLLPAAGKTSYVEKPIIVAQAGQRIESTGTRPVVQSNIRPNTSPNAIPTKTAKINSSIPNTVPQNVNKASQKGAQQAFGGVAGIEIKKDENGQMVVNFNPEKAIVGVIGMTAYNKLGAKVTNEVKATLAKRLKDRVIKELQNFDDSPVKVTGMTGNRLEGGNEDALLMLGKLKEKQQNGKFANTDTYTAIGAFKQQGVDIMKEEVDSAAKVATAPSSLLQEAKKYKTADEFVKAQGTPVYHGTNVRFDKFDKSKIGDTTGTGDWGDGFYFSDSKDVARSFANDAGGDIVMDVTLLKNLKFADGNKLEKLPEIQNILDDGMGFTDIGEYLKSKGYDGVKYKHTGNGGTEYIVYNPEVIQTKSLLTDIWNKANKK